MTKKPGYAAKPLDGGWGQDNAPEKIGDAVHRELSENSDYVHKVLTFLDKSGYKFAPKYLGIDDQSREMVEYIAGYVPHGQEIPPETWSLSTMESIFKRIRDLHDLTAGTELADKSECVCHGDLSYANTVYRNGKAVAFIDWDWAHPGSRIDDVGYALLQYLSLGEYESDGGPEERADLTLKLSNAYGLAEEQKRQLFDRMLQSLLSTRDKQLESARLGKPSGIRLAEAGVPEHMLKRHKWLKHNERTFRQVLK